MQHPYKLYYTAAYKILITRLVSKIFYSKDFESTAKELILLSITFTLTKFPLGCYLNFLGNKKDVSCLIMYNK